MPIERGKTFVLKIDDGMGVFNTVGKMRSNGFNGTKETITVTNKDTDGFNEKLPSPFKDVSLSAGGVYDGGVQQLKVRDAWLADSTHEFQMAGASGDTWEGPFIVTEFSSDGEHNGERTWSCTLESAGPVTVADA